MEVWKSLDFLDYPKYSVSNLGRIKGPLKILTPYIAGNGGYYQVKLCKDNKCKSFYLHVLVALAFIPNPNNLSDVNHKDGNKQRCIVDNLEWKTHRNNMKHASDTGLWPSRKWKPIGQYTLDTKELLNTFDSVAQAVHSLNKHHSGTSIRNCLEGRQDNAYGYIWRYLES